MDPSHSVALLSVPPTPNLMGVMQSKCAPSQAFPACCSFRSLPELHLHLLPRSSSGYILCSSQDTPLVPVFLLSIDSHLQFQKQCKGTSNMPLWSLLQSSGATQKPIQYYYVILGLTPIIPRALCCHPAHFPCSDPGYQCRDAKTL